MSCEPESVWHMGIKLNLRAIRQMWLNGDGANKQTNKKNEMVGERSG